MQKHGKNSKKDVWEGPLAKQGYFHPYLPLHDTGFTPPNQICGTLKKAEFIIGKF